ncbi:hypothetical protein LJJ21_004740 [Salmonella enterica]|nr:hypothetical protein [Salmonella enterica]
MQISVRADKDLSDDAIRADLLASLESKCAATLRTEVDSEMSPWGYMGVTAFFWFVALAFGMILMMLCDVSGLIPAGIGWGLYDDAPRWPASFPAFLAGQKFWTGLLRLHIIALPALLGFAFAVGVLRRRAHR